MTKKSADPDGAATRLFEVRSRLGMSQAAFAAHIGVSHRAYRNYEAGLRELPLSAFRGVVVACDLDAEWLLFGSAGREASAR
jgi:transcriptional regulator with XRE-family HTH domain